MKTYVYNNYNIFERSELKKFILFDSLERLTKMLEIIITEKHL